MGTIVFVHGTGVRLPAYQRGLETARKVAKACGLQHDFAECVWGDPLGVEFKGDSLPDPPDPKRLAQEEADFAQWNWLLDDPLFELDKLTTRDTSKAARAPAMPGAKPQWLKLWESIAAYEASYDLTQLLERGGLDGLWVDAWKTIVEASPIPRQAFEASAHELAEATHALARALIAQLYVQAIDSGIPGPSMTLRKSLLDRLIVDWKQQVYGLSAFFANMMKRASTRVLRKHRSSLSNAVALPIGDILLYQSRGQTVRDFIRHKIAAATPPVTVVAHSLGGIACVDLLALPNPPQVHRLVTAGSQAPLLYEIGALLSLKAPQPLPQGFPGWLNLYDRNDFLSYVANRCWPAVSDVEIESGQPFPDSHSAYFGNEATWKEIGKFIA
jgi:hypothetical protein